MFFYFLKSILVIKNLSAYKYNIVITDWKYVKLDGKCKLNVLLKNSAAVGYNIQNINAFSNNFTNDTNISNNTVITVSLTSGLIL